VKRTVIELTDDLDGSRADETVKIGLDGKSFELDLSKSNARKLRTILQPYIAGGRRVGRRAQQSSSPQRYDTTAVRRWAQANGIHIAQRGRIPREVLAQFESAGN
jgi:nucleoid-associated protein Lsr2